MSESAKTQPQKPTLGVAETCYWYRGGDTNREPLAAIVTKSDVHGLLDLEVFIPGARHKFPVTSVRHVSDAQMQARPHLARSDGDGKPGLWDFKPGTVVEVVRAEVDSKTQVIGGDENTALELYKESQDATKVAAEMTRRTGEEWSHQRVNAIVRKHKA